MAHERYDFSHGYVLMHIFHDFISQNIRDVSPKFLVKFFRNISKLFLY